MDSNDAIEGRVEFTVDEWRKRAKVAREGAEDLREALDAIADVGGRNYFGDCIEGVNVASKLNGAIETWRGQLRSQITELEQLASNCEIAADRYLESDSRGARDLQT